MSPTDSADDWARLRGSPVDVPHSPLDEETRLRRDFPRTLLPSPDGMSQSLVFEPALKQFSNAYRAGEPRFADEEAGRVWHQARRTVLDVVLASIANGPWTRHLVLRGSVLMATWFKEAARDPGDLDFVVVPQDWRLDEPRTTELFDGIARDAAAAGADSSVRIHADGMITEEIWTYDRVPGRRMLLPWTAPGCAGGTVQLDLVFNETLPAPAELTELRPLGDGPGCRLWAASPGLSLAWKLLWLITDLHPQGKDLYDAVLLAESAPPPYELVRNTFVLTGVEGLRPPGSWWAETLAVGQGWEHFTAEYVQVAGTAGEYLERLLRVLAPLLTASEPPGEDTYERWVRWLEPLIESTRATAGNDPAPALGHLAGGGWDGLMAAVVIVREVTGRQALDLEGALHAVLNSGDSWRTWRERPEWWPDVLDRLS